MLPVTQEYVRLLSGIPPFRIDYSYLTGGYTPLSAPVLTGVALLLALAGGAAFAWRTPAWRLAGLGLLWVGVFLMPVSNLLPMMQYMAERFLYLPLLGWLLVLATLAWHLRPRVALPVAAALILFWGGLAGARAGIWSDEITLFGQSSQQTPRVPRVETNAVYAYFELPAVRRVFAVERQETALNVALAVRPGLQRGDWAAALPPLTQGHALLPDNAALLNGLAIARAQVGNYPAALAAFKALSERDPGNAAYLTNYGLACVDAKQFALARTTLTCALALQPQNATAWHSLASACWQQRDYAAAEDCFRRLVILEPNNPENARWQRLAHEKAATASREQRAN